VEIAGSHCAYLSQPAVIADHLHSFSTDLRSPTTTT
jgi:hypothetical protein